MLLYTKTEMADSLQGHENVTYQEFTQFWWIVNCHTTLENNLLLPCEDESAHIL